MYRKKYRHKGEDRETKAWYVSVFARGKRQEINLRVHDQRSGQALANAIQRAIDYSKAKRPLTTEDEELLAGPQADVKLTRRLIDAGIIPNNLTPVEGDVEAMIEAFEEYARGRGEKPESTKAVVAEIRKTCEHFGWTQPHHFDWRKYQSWLKVRTGRNGVDLTKASLRAYVSRVDRFGKWCVDAGYVKRYNPFPYKSILRDCRASDRPKRRYEHMPLTADQYVALVQTTRATSRVHWNMTGPDRALLYALAVQTGFRWATLRQLVAGDFEFTDLGYMKVSVDESRVKNKKAIAVPVTDTTVIEWTRAQLANRTSKAPVWNPLASRPLDMLRRDLEHAGVDWKPGEVGRISFHSLRATTASLLSDAHIPNVVVRDRTGHSSDDMLKRYQHAFPESQIRAANALPRIAAG